MSIPRFIAAASVALGAGVFLAHAAPVVSGSAVAVPSRSGAGASFAPVYAPGGQHLAFVSLANNLVTNKPAGSHFDVFLRNLPSGDTTLVSVNASGFGGANGHSLAPAVSSNGLVVVFESEAANLGPSDTNATTDIYVRDLAAGMTRLVSVRADGAGSGNGRSWGPLLSHDGRYVVFESLASNLVTNDFNGTNDVFIRDLQTGRTSLVSLNAEGSGSADGVSEWPSLAADGLTVAFVSRGSNLVPGATNRLGEIYVRDLRQGVTRWAVASHLPALRHPVNGSYAASEPVLTPDGAQVIFKTQRGPVVRFDLRRETNSLVTEFPETIPPTRFRWDDNPRWAGDAQGSRFGVALSASADGRFVAFQGGPGDGRSNIVCRIDFETWITNVVVEAGDPSSTTTNQSPRVELVSVLPGTETPASGRASALALSADGERLLFISDSTNLVSEVTGGMAQLYMSERLAPGVRLLSTNLAGLPGTGLGSTLPVLSPDGARVAFETDDILVAGDLNQATDVHELTIASGQVRLVSERFLTLSSAVLAGHSYLLPNSISDDGQVVAFTTAGRGPASWMTNHHLGVWVRDFSLNTATLLVPAVQGYTMDPRVSADGRYVAYFQGTQSVAGVSSISGTSLARYDRLTGAVETFGAQRAYSIGGLSTYWSGPQLDFSRDGAWIAFENSVNSISQVFVRDLGAETNFQISVRSDGTPGRYYSWGPRFSPDARWVAFYSTDVGMSTNGLAGLFLRDRVTQTTRWLTPGGVVSDMNRDTTNWFQFSPDSRWVAFARQNQVWLQDLIVGTNLLVTAAGRTPAVSGEGRFVVAEVPAPGLAVSDIARFDTRTGAQLLISRGRSGGGGNRPSYAPSITADGRFVIFASAASDLVENDTNGVPDIFVRDTLLGTTLLASMNRFGTGSGNGWSSAPMLGADGRTVLFRSFASDLIPQDYNERRDVFLLRLAGADRDGDGLDDDWELAYFDGLGRDGGGDADGDGLSDRAEFLAGTSPTNEASVLRAMIVAGVAGGGGVTVLWSAVPGRSYRVQFKEGVDRETWQELGGVITAVTGTGTATDAAVTPGATRFYRVLQVP